MKLKNLTYASLAAAIGLSALACKQETTIIERELIKSPAQDDRPIYTVEGVVNGGGGKGVLCQKDGQPHLEVLDIHEGRYVYGLTYPEYASLEAAYRHHFNLEGKGEPRVVEEMIQNYNKLVKTTFRFLPHGYRLKDTQDSLEPFVLLGCEVVQIAVFYNEEIALVDGELWEMLSPLNQLALTLHEFHYARKRSRSSVEDSRSTRRLVAYGLSTEFVGTLDLDLDYDREYLSCISGKPTDPGKAIPSTEFLFQSDKEDSRKTHVYFTEFNGIPVYYNTSGTIDKSLEEIMGDDRSWTSLRLKRVTYPNYFADIQMHRERVQSCETFKEEEDINEDGTQQGSERGEVCSSSDGLFYRLYFDQGGFLSETERIETILFCKMRYPYNPEE